jgi:hypothetical protein
VSFTDSDCCYRADNFELILTTLEASFIFRGCWSSSKIWLELNIDPTLSNLPHLNRRKLSTGSPRYSRTFYLRIRSFTLEKRSKMIIFQSKMNFLSANSRFAVQNDGTYLLRITRETCTYY